MISNLNIIYVFVDFDVKYFDTNHNPLQSSFISFLHVEARHKSTKNNEEAYLISFYLVV